MLRTTSNFLIFIVVAELREDLNLFASAASIAAANKKQQQVTTTRCVSVMQRALKQTRTPTYVQVPIHFRHTKIIKIKGISFPLQQMGTAQKKLNMTFQTNARANVPILPVKKEL